MQNSSVTNSRFKTAAGKFLDFIIQHKAYILSFFLPIIILYTAYAIFGVYPFGEHSVLALDLNAQYVYYYDYLYDVFRGRESLFYCWSGSLSGEFAGLFAYYLASPFNLIILLFPRNSITEGIMAMLLLKCAAGGISACRFLKKERNLSDFTAILFSCMYALSGYFTAHTLNPMWLDALIALPWVLAGVERVCRERKFLMYALSLIYVFVTNFYIGYMVGIFSALYFAYCHISGKSQATFKNMAKSAGVFAGASVSAILVSCPILIPVYKSLKLGKMGGAADFSFAENFTLSDMLIKLFPAAYDTIRPEGLPMIYVGTLAVVMGAIFFTEKKFPRRLRISFAGLLGILVLSMYIKPVDMLWHGGQVPVWMPYRYSFILSFLLMTAAAETYEHFRAAPKRFIKRIGITAVIIVAVLLILDHAEGNEYFDTTLVIVLPLIFTAATCILLSLADNKKLHKPSCAMLAALVFGELMLNAVVTFEKAHGDVYYSSRESYVDDIPKTRRVMDELRKLDGGFYRSEKTYHRTVNDAMAVGMYGLSHSTSTFNTKTLNMLKTLGVGQEFHATRAGGITPLFGDIFGIKYLLTRDEKMSPYTTEVDIPDDEIFVYENENALPLAYLADVDVIGCGLYGGTPFEAQTALARVLADMTDEFFIPAEDFTFDCQNVNIGTTTDGHMSYKKRDEGAEISYLVTMPKTGGAFAFFPTNYERECALYVNGNYLRNYFEYENHSVAFLGNFTEGETVEVKLVLNREDLYFTEAVFRVTDNEALERFREKMRGLNPETTVERTGAASLKVTVTAEEDCALFTTIPFEEGWQVKIDGEKTTPLPCVNGSLMCLRVPEGNHEITFSFLPAGFVPGLFLMLAGLAILVGMTAAARILTKFEEEQDG